MLTKTNQTGLFDGNKGRLLLEIAKTFKGDQRFKLDKRFKDDVEVDKLPEKFKKIVEKEVVEKALGKTKKIEKARPPLIITRF